MTPATTGNLASPHHPMPLKGMTIRSNPSGNEDDLATIATTIVVAIVANRTDRGGGNTGLAGCGPHSHGGTESYAVAGIFGLDFLGLSRI